MIPEALVSSLVAWTIRLSMLMMFLSLVARTGIRQNVVKDDGNGDPGDEEGAAQKTPDLQFTPKWRVELAQHTWLLGSLFALMHTIVTLILVFDGDHAAAFEHTAVTTEAYLGVRVGIGIYANHIFVLLWIFDALWFLGNADRYLTRKKWVTIAILGYLLFIAFNGTIVFAAGPVRYFALAACLTLAFVSREHWMRPA